MTHPRKHVLLGLALVLAGLALRPAQAANDFFDSDAQTPSPITDFFSLRASYFHASVKTDLRLDPPGVPLGGTPLSGTQDLGFRSTDNDGRAELMFRLRERNRITADFMELDESGTRTLSQTTTFGNQQLTPGDTLSSHLQWRTMGLTYTYAFIQNDRVELGAGLGVHLMDLDVRGNVPQRFLAYETSIAGALPTPALEAVWRVTRQFSLTARGGYLKGTINSTFGDIGDFHADAQFRIVPNLSVGAGYSLMKFKLDSVTESDPGLISIRLRGPEVFLRASF